MNTQRLTVPGAGEVSLAPPLPSIAPPEEDFETPGISLAQVSSILRAYWKVSLLTFLALVAVFSILIELEPKSYVATATLIVNHGDRNPLATIDLPTGLQNTFLPTQIQLIGSPVVLEPVVRRLNLMSDREFTRGFKGSRAALRETVLVNLFKALKVSSGKKSDLLYVAATSRSAEKAAAIANAVAREYLKLNRQRIDEPAVERARIYSRELADLRAKTIAAQDQVTAFRQRHGMIDLAPGGTDEDEVALVDLEQKLLAAQSEERSLAAQLQARAWGATAPGAYVADSLANELALEQSQLAKLRETLGPAHPEVRALESQIAATRRTIEGRIAAQLSDAQKLVAQYSAAVAAQRKRVLRRRSVQDEGTKLLLELQSAEATYKRALDGYPQIEFATHGHSSDVTLVSLAAPPPRPLSPDKVQNFLASCGIALALAFGLPFLYELRINRRLRCREDLERHFGIPVLAQFGPLGPRGWY